MLTIQLFGHYKKIQAKETTLPFMSLAQIDFGPLKTTKRVNIACLMGRIYLGLELVLRTRGYNERFIPGLAMEQYTIARISSQFNFFI